MKKFLTITIAFILTFGVILSTGVGKVSAQTVPVVQTPDWVWINPDVPATIIPTSLVTPAGPAWQQLISTGLKIAGPAKVCYPFRGAQFGWKGQIRMLLNGKWVPMTTTIKWDPTIEGHLMACATARYAGTYALFGYWQPTE